MSQLIDSNTKMKVFELQVNGTRLLTEFENEIYQQNKKGTYATTIKIIEQSANGLMLPKGKFRKIENTGLPCKFYEAKKDDVRIYMFQDEAGRVIICGGFKGKQKKDLRKYINLVKDYLNEKS